MLFDQLDLHDAVLREIAVSWKLGACIAHLDASGGPVSITWSFVEEVSMSRRLPWGPSSSVLEFRVDESGQDELRMQSGDVITVRARRRLVESGKLVCERYASLAVDALASAALVASTDMKKARGIVQEELEVRRALGDL